MDDIPLQWSRLNALQRGHEDLIEQIRLSQKTIEHSLELIKRLDGLLARQKAL
jgi:hypothetical protein